MTIQRTYKVLGFTIWVKTIEICGRYDHNVAEHLSAITKQISFIQKDLTEMKAGTILTPLTATVEEPLTSKLEEIVINAILKREEYGEMAHSERAFVGSQDYSRFRYRETKNQR